jgi:hypothetical protein
MTLCAMVVDPHPPRALHLLRGLLHCLLHLQLVVDAPCRISRTRTLASVIFATKMSCEVKETPSMPCFIRERQRGLRSVVAPVDYTRTIVHGESKDNNSMDCPDRECDARPPNLAALLSHVRAMHPFEDYRPELIALGGVPCSQCDQVYTEKSIRQHGTCAQEHPSYHRQETQGSPPWLERITMKTTTKEVAETTVTITMSRWPSPQPRRQLAVEP